MYALIQFECSVKERYAHPCKHHDTRIDQQSWNEHQQNHKSDQQ